MKNNIEDLLDEYFKWLKDKTSIKPVNGWDEITTPYLDIHNDYLQIYAKLEKDGIILSDGGYILSDLNNAGCPINTDKRKQLLEITLRGFGVENNKGELRTEANEANFSIKKHNIIQAMLAVHDIFYTSTPVTATLFTDDVSDWLNINKIRSISQVKFTGKSGFDYIYDFVIPKSEQNKNERFIRTINTLTNEKAKTLVFSWLDIMENRSNEAKAYAFINDRASDVLKIQNDAISALKNYKINPVLWSNKEEVLQELVA